ncbi:MAG TPA: hypothetical protein VNX68_16040 [Nitrosopumilaceae archaeon]|jgi:hypothetical protein|nr:hypothetical protein [Nitrosopumilaceae archaeon]
MEHIEEKPKYSHQIKKVIKEGMLALNVCRDGKIKKDAPTILRLVLEDQSTLMLQFDSHTGKLKDVSPYT